MEENREMNGECTGLVVQGSFGKPDNRECTVAEFSDNHVMKQVAKTK